MSRIHLVEDDTMIASGISLPFHISVWTYLFAGVFSFCIVLFSAYRPAKKVGKFTAIQCVKGIGAGTALKEIQVKDSVIQKIFECESAIAKKHEKKQIRL